jgi:hypothetical protein
MIEDVDVREEEEKKRKIAKEETRRIERRTLFNSSR